MIEELISRVFATRNAAHLAHWSARGVGSYARHMALGDFYEGLLGKIDAIVEMYQGAFGLVENIPATSALPSKIAEHIAEEAKWIQANRAAVADGVTAIENAIDDLIGHYLTTYYKLANLT